MQKETILNVIEAMPDDVNLDEYPPQIPNKS